jgi:uncharacterized protein YndB with AHSA1/START domain
MAPKTDYEPPVSDEAVFAKTGKRWAEWFQALDAAGARKLSHKEIVAVVRDQHGAGPWWQQMVTVTYEQARGLRAKHEMPSGYQVSVSKTLGAPVAQVYRAWRDGRARARWYAGPAFTVRKATPEKTLRLTWADETHVEVSLYARGDAKTQVTIQHSKLPTAAAAEKLKRFWAERLADLKARLEA